MGITKKLIISMLIVTTVHAADGKKTSSPTSSITITSVAVGCEQRRSKSFHSLETLGEGMEKMEKTIGQLTRWAVGNQGELSDLNDYAGVGDIKGNGSQGPPGGADQALEILWRTVGILTQQIKNQAIRIVALENARESHSPPYTTDTSFACDTWLESSDWKSLTKDGESSSPSERCASLPDLSRRHSSSSLELEK